MNEQLYMYIVSREHMWVYSCLRPTFQWLFSLNRHFPLQSWESLLIFRLLSSDRELLKFIRLESVPSYRCRSTKEVTQLWWHSHHHSTGVWSSSSHSHSHLRMASWACLCRSLLISFTQTCFSWTSSSCFWTHCEYQRESQSMQKPANPCTCTQSP